MLFCWKLHGKVLRWFPCPHGEHLEAVAIVMTALAKICRGKEAR